MLFRSLDFSVVLYSIKGTPLRGEPIFDEQTKELTGYKDSTLGSCAFEGLFADEKGLSGTKKMERHRLGAMVQKSIESKEPVDLKVEEVSLIKELVGQHCNVATVGAVWNEIERQSSAKAEDKPAEGKA